VQGFQFSTSRKKNFVEKWDFDVLCVGEEQIGCSKFMKTTLLWEEYYNLSLEIECVEIANFQFRPL